MRASVKDAKALAFIEAVLLVALALLSAGSEPPVVDIPSVPSIDEGTVVRVSGHVVDIWAWDDGSENLVLADLASGATLRALCREELHRRRTYPQRSAGDEGDLPGQPSHRSFPPCCRMARPIPTTTRSWNGAVCPPTSGRSTKLAATW